MTDQTANESIYRTVNSLDECIAESQNGPVILFKHSAVCPTSHYAKREMDSFLPTSSVPVYLIVVQENRPLSAAIAQRLNTRHESPQALIVQGGEVKAVFNHSEITQAKLQAALA